MLAPKMMQLRQDVEVMQRYASYYQQQFTRMIDTLNRQTVATAETQCLRLCVEAVNMVLDTQSRLACSLRDLEPIGPLAHRPSSVLRMRAAA